MDPRKITSDASRSRSDAPRQINFISAPSVAQVSDRSFGSDDSYIFEEKGNSSQAIHLPGGSGGYRPMYEDDRNIYPENIRGRSQVYAPVDLLMGGYLPQRGGGPPPGYMAVAVDPSYHTRPSSLTSERIERDPSVVDLRDRSLRDIRDRDLRDVDREYSSRQRERDVEIRSSDRDDAAAVYGHSHGMRMIPSQPGYSHFSADGRIYAPSLYDPITGAPIAGHSSGMIPIDSRGRPILEYAPSGYASSSDIGMYPADGLDPRIARSGIEYQPGGSVGFDSRGRPIYALDYMDMDGRGGYHGQVPIAVDSSGRRMIPSDSYYLAQTQGGGSRGSLRDYPQQIHLDSQGRPYASSHHDYSVDRTDRDRSERIDERSGLRKDTKTERVGRRSNSRGRSGSRGRSDSRHRTIRGTGNDRDRGIRDRERERDKEKDRERDREREKDKDRSGRDRDRDRDRFKERPRDISHDRGIVRAVGIEKERIKSEKDSERDLDRERERDRLSRHDKEKDKPDLRERLTREREIFDREREIHLERPHFDLKDDADKINNLNQDTAMNFIEKSLLGDVLKSQGDHSTSSGSLQVSHQSLGAAGFQPPLPIGRPPMHGGLVASPHMLMGGQIAGHGQVVGSLGPMGPALIPSMGSVGHSHHSYQAHPNSGLYLQPYGHPGNQSAILIPQQNDQRYVQQQSQVTHVSPQQSQTHNQESSRNYQQHQQGNSNNRGGNSNNNNFNSRGNNQQISGGRSGNDRFVGSKGGRGGSAPMGGWNRQMGTVDGIFRFSGGKDTGMTNEDICKVIAPPLSERDRSCFLDKTAEPHKENSIVLPTNAPWRSQSQTILGKKLEPHSDTVIRSNHFLIDASGIAKMLYQYTVQIYPIDKDNRVSKYDAAPKMDSTQSTALVLTIRDRNPWWNVGRGTGLTYDGKSVMFSSQALALPNFSIVGDPMLVDTVAIKCLDGSESQNLYRIRITQVNVINTSVDRNTSSPWCRYDVLAMQALESSVLGFAKWQVVEPDMSWFIVGSHAFQSAGKQLPLAQPYIALRGYYAGLKMCAAGLTLVADMCVNSFLTGGEMIDIMSFAGGFSSFRDFVSSCNHGLVESVCNRIDKCIKSIKVNLKHIRQSRKCKGIGPPADSPDSSFFFEGLRITVADYFKIMAKDPVRGPDFLPFLHPEGRLRYPYLPTINVGAGKNSILIPAELLLVPAGQGRIQNSGEDTALLMKYAVAKPQDRFAFLQSIDTQTVVSVLQKDPTAQAFGVGNISRQPMAISAVLLPQAKLRYANNETVDPKFSGAWSPDNKKFYIPAPSPFNDPISFAIIIVGGVPHDQTWEKRLNELSFSLEREGLTWNCRLRMFEKPSVCPSNPKEISNRFKMLVENGVRCVVVALMDQDKYGMVKYESDRIGLPSQCLLWKKIEKSPRGFVTSVLLKLNSKLGGTNHTLTSRLSSKDEENLAGTIFQDPPASISWLFDKPCMMVGIDVSHCEAGSAKDSMAAVVASMDGRGNQYAAYLSALGPRQEIVHNLEEAMKSLLGSFKSRNNGCIPETMIVYRDGVAENQFDQVNNIEVVAIKSAIAALGYTEDTIKIAVVICQKRHHTRLVFEDKVDGTVQFLNPCPGLVVDHSAGNTAITCAFLNEFYLHSHTAIQGTSKPCKYTLIFDEIGFKHQELELLTYWSTYLYCRCNRSVSVATPAYYAHWASKRGRHLFGAGAKKADLVAISNLWGNATKESPMFFV